MPEQKNKNKELLWWQVLFIIITAVILLYLTTLYKWKQLGYGAPILPFFALFFPLITVAKWKWWQAALSLVGLMIIIMLIITFTPLRYSYLFVSRSFVPTALIASLSVLIASIIENIKASREKSTEKKELDPLEEQQKKEQSTMYGSDYWIAPILSSLFLIYTSFTGLGNGNVVSGGSYAIILIKQLLQSIWNNLARSLVSLSVIIYLISYFTWSSHQTSNWFGGSSSSQTTSGWSYFYNIMWAVLAILMGVWGYSASVSVFTTQDSFLKRLSSIFIGSPVQQILKVLAFIIICFGLIYGIGSLIGSSTLASNIVTGVIQIICVLAILTVILKYIMNHPRIIAAIAGNPIVKLIFNIIFIIPCLLVYLISGFKNIKILPESNSVYIILLLEILTICAYVFLPMFRKWLYTFTPFRNTNSDFSVKQRTSGTYNAIYAATKKLNKEKAMGQTTPFGSGVDWDMIYSKQLYLKDDIHTKALRTYLISLGYKDNYGIRDNFFIEKILGRSLTLTAAISYIQTTGRVEKIMSDSEHIENMNNKLAAFKKQETDKSGPFNSKILLNKPYYINKQKYLGLYENLKGMPSGIADDYNYNYGLSCWVYLMPQGAEYGVGYSKFTKILDYGNKPTILFNPEINTLKITVKAYKKGNNTPYNKTVYTTKDLPLQKWNNIVFNYIGGTLDIFINKDLVASVNNVVPYMAPDSITIGDNPGISGAVANVTYFSSPITKSRITFFYNDLVNKDPPII